MPENNKRLPFKVGKQIKAARKAKGLKQEDLARMTGIARAQISQWEAEVRNPMTNNFNRIAQALDMTASDLLNYQLDSELNIDDMVQDRSDDPRVVKVQLINLLLLGLSQVGLDEVLRITTEMTKNEKYSRKIGEDI